MTGEETEHGRKQELSDKEGSDSAGAEEYDTLLRIPSAHKQLTTQSRLMIQDGRFHSSS